jgi:hypothetical protein
MMLTYRKTVYWSIGTRSSLFVIDGLVLRLYNIPRDTRLSLSAIAKMVAFHIMPIAKLVIALHHDDLGFPDEDSLVNSLL